MKIKFAFSTAAIVFAMSGGFAAAQDVRVVTDRGINFLSPVVRAFQA